MLWAQCPDTAIILSSQAEVDAFVIDYPNCTELTVDLEVNSTSSNISSLQGLRNLTSVTSILIKDNPGLTNLSGIENLEIATGTVSIDSNLNLTDVSALNKLSSVNSLIISNSPMILLENAFPNLNNCFFLMFENDQNIPLAVDGFDSLLTLFGLSYEGNVIVRPIPNLESAIILTLRNIPELTSIKSNEVTSVGNISNIDFVELDSFNTESIQEYDNIQNFRFRSVNVVQLEDLTLRDSAYGLEFRNCNKINNLDLISESKLNYLGFNEIDFLTEIPQLNQTTEEIGINIISNPNLISLDGLSKVKKIVGLTLIRENAKLNSCAVRAVCERLVENPRDIFIDSNDERCNSKEEVESACETVSTIADKYITNIIVFPNPATHTIFIENMSATTQTEYHIFNPSGQSILKIDHSVSKQGIDISSLTPGIYWLVSTDQMQQVKFVVGQ